MDEDNRRGHKPKDKKEDKSSTSRHVSSQEKTWRTYSKSLIVELKEKLAARRARTLGLLGEGAELSAFCEVDTESDGLDDTSSQSHISASHHDMEDRTHHDMQWDHGPDLASLSETSSLSDMEFCQHAGELNDIQPDLTRAGNVVSEKKRQFTTTATECFSFSPPRSDNTTMTSGKFRFEDTREFVSIGVDCDSLKSADSESGMSEATKCSFEDSDEGAKGPILPLSNSLGKSLQNGDGREEAKADNKIFQGGDTSSTSHIFTTSDESPALSRKTLIDNVTHPETPTTTSERTVGSNSNKPHNLDLQKEGKPTKEMEINKPTAASSVESYHPKTASFHGGSLSLENQDFNQYTFVSSPHTSVEYKMEHYDRDQYIGSINDSIEDIQIGGHNLSCHPESTELFKLSDVVSNPNSSSPCENIDVVDSKSPNVKANVADEGPVMGSLAAGDYTFSAVKSERSEVFCQNLTLEADELLKSELTLTTWKCAVEKILSIIKSDDAFSAELDKRTVFLIEDQLNLGPFYLHGDQNVSSNSRDDSKGKTSIEVTPSKAPDIVSFQRSQCLQACLKKARLVSALQVNHDTAATKMGKVVTKQAYERAVREFESLVTRFATAHAGKEQLEEDASRKKKEENQPRVTSLPPFYSQKNSTSSKTFVCVDKSKREARENAATGRSKVKRSSTFVVGGREKVSSNKSKDAKPIAGVGASYSDTAQASSTLHSVKSSLTTCSIQEVLNQRPADPSQSQEVKPVSTKTKPVISSQGEDSDTESEGSQESGFCSSHKYTSSFLTQLLDYSSQEEDATEMGDLCEENNVKDTHGVGASKLLKKEKDNSASTEETKSKEHLEKHGPQLDITVDGKETSHQDVSEKTSLISKDALSSPIEDLIEEDNPVPYESDFETGSDSDSPSQDFGDNVSSKDLNKMLWDNLQHIKDADISNCSFKEAEESDDYKVQEVTEGCRPVNKPLSRNALAEVTSSKKDSSLDKTTDKKSTCFTDFEKDTAYSTDAKHGEQVEEKSQPSATPNHLSVSDKSPPQTSKGTEGSNSKWENKKDKLWSKSLSPKQKSRLLLPKVDWSSSDDDSADDINSDMSPAEILRLRQIEQVDGQLRHLKEIANRKRKSRSPHKRRASKTDKVNFCYDNCGLEDNDQNESRCLDVITESGVLNNVSSNDKDVELITSASSLLLKRIEEEGGEKGVEKDATDLEANNDRLKSPAEMTATKLGPDNRFIELVHDVGKGALNSQNEPSFITNKLENSIASLKETEQHIDQRESSQVNKNINISPETLRLGVKLSNSDETTDEYICDNKEERSLSLSNKQDRLESTVNVTVQENTEEKGQVEDRNNPLCEPLSQDYAATISYPKSYHYLHGMRESAEDVCGIGRFEDKQNKENGISQSVPNSVDGQYTENENAPLSESDMGKKAIQRKFETVDIDCADVATYFDDATATSEGFGAADTGYDIMDLMETRKCCSLTDSPINPFYEEVYPVKKSEILKTNTSKEDGFLDKAQELTLYCEGKRNEAKSSTTGNRSEIRYSYGGFKDKVCDSNKKPNESNSKDEVFEKQTLYEDTGAVERNENKMIDSDDIREKDNLALSIHFNKENTTDALNKKLKSETLKDNYGVWKKDKPQDDNGNKPCEVWERYEPQDDSRNKHNDCLDERMLEIQPSQEDVVFGQKAQKSLIVESLHDTRGKFDTTVTTECICAQTDFGSMSFLSDASRAESHDGVKATPVLDEAGKSTTDTPIPEIVMQVLNKMENIEQLLLSFQHGRGTFGVPQSKSVSVLHNTDRELSPAAVVTGGISCPYYFSPSMETQANQTKDACCGPTFDEAAAQAVGSLEEEQSSVVLPPESVGKQSERCHVATQLTEVSTRACQTEEGFPEMETAERNGPENPTNKVAWEAEFSSLREQLMEMKSKIKENGVTSASHALRFVELERRLDSTVEEFQKTVHNNKEHILDKLKDLERKHTKTFLDSVLTAKEDLVACVKSEIQTKLHSVQTDMEGSVTKILQEMDSQFKALRQSMAFQNEDKKAITESVDGLKSIAEELKTSPTAKGMDIETMKMRIIELTSQRDSEKVFHKITRESLRALQRDHERLRDEYFGARLRRERRATETDPRRTVRNFISQQCSYCFNNNQASTAKQPEQKVEVKKPSGPAGCVKKGDN